MNKRLKKQIIIALIVLGIFSAIGGGIYLTHKPEPTCFDEIQNQKEEGIDCGGPCISCDLKYNPPLSLAAAPILLTNENGKIDVLFKIINRSEQWGAKSFSYKVIFTGANGEKQEFIKSGFILPHEVRYFLVSNLTTGFQPLTADVEIIKEDISWELPPSGIDLSLGDPLILSNVKIVKPEPISQMAYNVYTFTKTLEPGMEDAEVFNLQKVLSLDPSIYPEGQITGYYGKLTEAAVMRFQKKYGIRITGEVGDQTRAKLNELYGPGSQALTYNFTLHLKKGDRGDEVLNLQKALMLDSTVAPLGSITGYFDDITEKALEDFQLKHGLSVTGEVDAETRAKLNELFSNSSRSANQELTDELEPYEASLEVSGSIYNKTPFNWRKGDVVIVLCDSNKKPIATGSTVLENIYSEQTVNFVIRWRDPLPENISVCERVVNINILDTTNAFLTH